MPIDASICCHLLLSSAIGYCEAMVEYIYWPRESAGKTTIFPGFELWNEVDAELDDYHGYDVRALIRLHSERLEVDELKVIRRPDGEPVTGIGIREFSIPALIRKSLSANAPDMPEQRIAFGLLTKAEAEDAKAAGPTDDSLRKVAMVYRAALATQSPPTKAVQDVFDLAARTAGSWIAKAKAKGYIPEADQTAEVSA
jgi:hypothetical protein